MFYCNICKFRADSQRYFNQHCNSNKHKDAISNASSAAIKALPPYFTQKTYYCFVCDTDSVSKANFTVHCNSVGHVEMQGSKKVKVDQNASYRCGLKCNFSNEDRLEFEKHLQSTAHLSNIPAGKIIQKQLFTLYNADLNNTNKSFEKNNRNDEYADVNPRKRSLSSSSSKKDIILKEENNSSEIKDHNVNNQSDSYCNLCDYQAGQVSNFDVHCSLLKHKEALNKATKEQIQLLPPFLTQKSFFCEPCQYMSCNFNKFLFHCTTESHKNTPGTKKMQNDKEGYYRCGLKCNYKSNQRDEFEKHIQSSIHLSHISNGRFVQAQRLPTISNNTTSSSIFIPRNISADKRKTQNNKNISQIDFDSDVENSISSRKRSLNISEKGVDKRKDKMKKNENNLNVKLSLISKKIESTLLSSSSSEDEYKIVGNVSNRKSSSYLESNTLTSKKRSITTNISNSKKEISSLNTSKSKKLSIKLSSSASLKNNNIPRSNHVNSATEDRIGLFKCGLCNFQTVNSAFYDLHCMGIKHKGAISNATKQEILELPPCITLKTFYCKPCNYETMHHINFTNHCNFTSHKEMPGSDSINLLQDSMFRCGLKCEFVSDSRSDFEKHIQSSIHLSHIPLGHAVQRESCHVYIYDSEDENDGDINNADNDNGDSDNDDSDNDGSDNDDDNNNTDDDNANDDSIADISIVNEKVKQVIKSKPKKVVSDIDSNNSSSQFICGLCNFKGKMQSNYDDHCANHKHKLALSVNSNEDILALRPYHARKTYKCKECPFETLNKGHFLTHISYSGHKNLKSDQINMFRCNLKCNFKSEDRFLFEEHMISTIHNSNIPKGKVLQRQFFTLLDKNVIENFTKQRNYQNVKMIDSSASYVDVSVNNTDEFRSYPVFLKRNVRRVKFILEKIQEQEEELTHIDSDEDDNEESIIARSNKSKKYSSNSSQWKCNICDFQAASSYSFNQHCSSFKHREAVSRSPRDQVELLTPYFQLKTLFCEVCKFESLFKHPFVKHCNSYSHLELPGSRKINVNQEPMFRCVIHCNFHTIDRTEYEIHMQSKNHLSNIPVGKSMQKQLINNNNNNNNVLEDDIDIKSNKKRSVYDKNENKNVEIIKKNYKFQKNSSFSNEYDDYYDENDDVDIPKKRKRNSNTSNKSDNDSDDDKSEILLTCNICNFSSTAYYNYDMHCSSHKHKEALLSATAKQINALPAYHTKKSYLCEDCNYETFFRNNFRSHCDTFAHKKFPNYKKFHNNLDYSYRCGLKCKFATKSRYLFEMHIQSEIHLSNVPKGLAIQKERISFQNSTLYTAYEDTTMKKDFKCGICDFLAKNITMYDKHCMGLKHIAMVSTADPKDVALLLPNKTHKSFFCKACSFKTIYRDDFIVHCNSSRHFNTPGINKDDINQAPKLRCLLKKCDFATEDRNEFEKHLISKKHLSYISDGQILQKERFNIHEPPNEIDFDHKNSKKVDKSLLQKMLWSKK